MNIYQISIIYLEVLLIGIEPELRLFEEMQKLRQVVVEDPNYFKLFANSFLIEASNVHIENKVKFVSFNNMRKTEYRLMTVMDDEKVVKTSTTEFSKKHIETMANNIAILKSRGIFLLDRVENGKIISELCDEEKFLIKKITVDYTDDKFIELIVNLKENVYNKLEKYQGGIKVFEKYNIEVAEELDSQLHYVKDGMIDLTVFNCFYKDKEYYFFDQEWNYENVPVEYIMYRNLDCNNFDIKIDDIDYIYEKLGIKDYVELFKQLEKGILNEIIDNKMIDIYKTQNYTLRDLIRKEQETGNQAIIELKKQIEDRDIKYNQVVNSKGWKFLEHLRKYRRKQKRIK